MQLLRLIKILTISDLNNYQITRLMIIVQIYWVKNSDRCRATAKKFFMDLKDPIFAGKNYILKIKDDPSRRSGIHPHGGLFGWL